ncbi:putative ferric-chelate reductase 1 [Rhinophrynus dorsalis]
MDSLFHNFVALLFVILPLHIVAFPNGRVEPACSTMIPHHGVEPQTSQAPYTLTTSSNTYSPGQEITVTLSTTGTQFKGFLIQARTDNGTTPVGSFKVITPDAQPLTCTTAAAAVSHTSNNLKTSIQVIWVAADSNGTDIHFRATVVENKLTFWTNVVSSRLTFSETLATTVVPISSTTMNNNSTSPTTENSGFRLSAPSFREFLFYLLIAATAVLRF